MTQFHSPTWPPPPVPRKALIDAMVEEVVKEEARVQGELWGYGWPPSAQSELPCAQCGQPSKFFAETYVRPGDGVSGHRPFCSEVCQKEWLEVGHRAIGSRAAATEVTEAMALNPFRRWDGPGVKLESCAFCGLLVRPEDGYSAAVCNGLTFCADGCFWRHKLVEAPSVDDIYEGRVAKANAYREARRADTANHLLPCCGHRGGAHDPPGTRRAGRCHVAKCECGRAKAIARSKETGEPGPIMSCWLDIVDDVRRLLPWGLGLSIAIGLGWVGVQGARDDAAEKAKAQARPPPTPEEEIMQAADTLVRGMERMR